MDGVNYENALLMVLFVVWEDRRKDGRETFSSISPENCGPSPSWELRQLVGEPNSNVGFSKTISMTVLMRI